MTEKQADSYESLRDASMSFPPYPVAGKSFFGLANVSLCLPIKSFLCIIANRHHISKVYRQCGENQALDKVAHRDRLCGHGGRTKLGPTLYEAHSSAR